MPNSAPCALTLNNPAYYKFVFENLRNVKVITLVGNYLNNFDGSLNWKVSVGDNDDVTKNRVVG